MSVTSKNFKRKTIVKSIGTSNIQKPPMIALFSKNTASIEFQRGSILEGGHEHTAPPRHFFGGCSVFPCRRRGMTRFLKPPTVGFLSKNIASITFQRYAGSQYFVQYIESVEIKWSIKWLMTSFCPF